MENVFGLIGEKLGHSISPEIHSKIFQKTNYNGKYYIFEIEKENLENSFKGFKLLKIGGLNVTIPYKSSVIPFMDEISSEAKAIGAINTIRFSNGKCYGYNTDYYGFGYMMERANVTPRSKSAYVLGDGGATKAIIKYLVDNGAESISIVSRHKESTRENKEFKDYNILSYDELKDIKCKDIVINCTPCGMYPNIDSTPIDKNIISKFDVALDIIYNPSETLFLKIARELGLKGENGLSMLVGQAVYAQEIFRGEKLDKTLIDDICEEIAVNY
ncbi:shikimate dehydrogenase [Clostridium cylindrosporum]|uniref:Shikimate dehydrogenase (NADP(+)) n=1 Tax=Clostridium cylindrosporum DSM 605 TaxID=1121307 RepID=A0A0J8DAH3_CLOCY|nr:shikimate dehydrogenase [Clostridium cylindrosporum]KMT21324.1 shikimate dehydrogenase AroE [Clostridium cylindrosporum DSM 605]